MARTQTTETAKAPDFNAYHVVSRNDKAFWTKIGASWLHHDGNGMTLQLETLPMNGRIVLRAPREQTDEGRA